MHAPPIQAPVDEPGCPFCGTPLAARVRVCPGCKAQRRPAAGMTPGQFRLLVALWCLLALPVLAFALYLAALPWTPTGTPPGYALSLVGASDGRPPSRCRVVVFDANGQRSEAVGDAPCDTQAPGPQAAGTPASRHAAAGPHGDPSGTDAGTPGLTTLRLASALHSALALTGGGVACWLLLASLRLLMRRRRPGSWVRRVAA